MIAFRKFSFESRRNDNYSYCYADGCEQIYTQIKCVRVDVMCFDLETKTLLVVVVVC